MKSYEDKVRKLNELLDEIARQDVCLAFSGGVDSSLLLKLLADKTQKAGTKIYGVTFQTSLHPQADLAIAEKVAREAGAIHKVLPVNEWEDDRLRHNPRNRCYLCKKLLFEKLLGYAREKHISHVLEGTNVQELTGYRPGFQAVRELGITSPLVGAEFTKEDVRRLAKTLGISVSNRPSSPCLATRFPYGDKLDEALFPKIEAGETFFRENGFYNVRLRVHREILRIEVDTEDLHQLLLMRDEMIAHMKSLGFVYVTLDLEGFRSGSMDVEL